MVNFSPPVAPALPPEYRTFWQLWREGNYFACHEVLEDLWREESGERRRFYHGLIHCAVSLYQHQRGNAYGAARQLVRARVRLEIFRPKYLQVEIEALLQAVCDEIAPSLQSLDARQEVRLARLEDEVRSHFL